MLFGPTLAGPTLAGPTLAGPTLAGAMLGAALTGAAAMLTGAMLTGAMLTGAIATGPDGWIFSVLIAAGRFTTGATIAPGGTLGGPTAADAAPGGGMVTGPEPSPSRAPHPPQNREPGALSVPQVPHRIGITLSNLSQHQGPRSFSRPRDARIGVLPSTTGGHAGTGGPMQS
jgi:hypothetical protein